MSKMIGNNANLVDITLKPIAFYYGWPSAVNDAWGWTNVAANTFNNYDIVVFPSPLEYAGGDHDNTIEIINYLNNFPTPTETYGYIITDTIMNNWPLEGELSIKERVDNWKLMGVTGIFLDCFGSDYGVNRVRQNWCLDYVHSVGLKAFVNCWYPLDLFDDGQDSTWTVGGIGGVPINLEDGDRYLFESFVIKGNVYDTTSDWIAKVNLAENYRVNLGKNITFTSVTTVETSGDTDFYQAKFDYAWWVSLVYGFSHMGWGEEEFNSLSSNMPFRTRPADISTMGSYLKDNSVINLDPFYQRRTTKGTIWFNTSTNTGGFAEG